MHLPLLVLHLQDLDEATNNGQVAGGAGDGRMKCCDGFIQAVTKNKCGEHLVERLLWQGQPFAITMRMPDAAGAGLKSLANSPFKDNGILLPLKSSYMP